MIRAALVLLLWSPVDFIAMLFERAVPFAPDLSHGRPGNWHHAGKNWWTEAFRADAQWWSKCARFLVWWLAFLWMTK